MLCSARGLEPSRPVATLADANDRYITTTSKAIGRTKAQVLRSIKSHAIADMTCAKLTRGERLLPPGSSPARRWWPGCSTWWRARWARAYRGPIRHRSLPAAEVSTRWCWKTPSTNHRCSCSQVSTAAAGWRSSRAQPRQRTWSGWCISSCRMSPAIGSGAPDTDLSPVPVWRAAGRTGACRVLRHRRMA